MRIGKLLGVAFFLGLSTVTSANSVTFDFTGSSGGVSASGSALFLFKSGELDITVSNTTVKPDQITQAIQGLSWTYATALTGSYTWSATVIPVTIASNGTPTFGSSRAINTSGNGWSSTLTSLLTSNKDMIIDTPVSNTPNGSLTN